MPCSQEPSTGTCPDLDQCSPYHPILLLSSHLSLGLPSGLFPSDFPTKILYVFLSAYHKLLDSFNQNVEISGKFSTYRNNIKMHTQFYSRNLRRREQTWDTVVDKMIIKKTWSYWNMWNEDFDAIHQAQDRIQWRTSVNTKMKFHVLWNSGKLSGKWVITRFSWNWDILSEERVL
jgi:hypothetical protein